MPRKPEMTWEPGPRRWKKIYRGQTFIISCRQLGAPETKEGSYRAANAWWARTRAEIDGQLRPLHHDPEIDAHLREVQAELAPVRDELQRRREWADRTRHQDLAKEQARRLAELDLAGSPDALLLPMDIEKRLEALRTVGVIVPPDLDPAALAYVLGEPWVRAARHRNSPAPAPINHTVGYHVGRYLDLQLTRQRNGQISTSNYDQTRQALESFQSWMRPETAIDSIDADRWEAWYLHLLASGVSKDTKRNRMRRPRDFVAWLGSKGLIPVPSNLLSRRFRFKEGDKPIVILTDDEVAAVIKAAKGILRLHLLLSLNCGMGASEIANLTQDEVDWERARIIRKRHKTGDKAAVPTVNYPLWPETFTLLRQYRAQGERVLMTQSGLPWVRDELDESGKRHRVDAIRSLYAPVARRVGMAKPFQAWRRTAASKVDHHPEYALYTQHFLGHVPTGIAGKLYVAPSQDRFDAAVAWLGEQYGFDLDNSGQD